MHCPGCRCDFTEKFDNDIPIVNYDIQKYIDLIDKRWSLAKNYTFTDAKNVGKLKKAIIHFYDTTPEEKRRYLGPIYGENIDNLEELYNMAISIIQVENKSKKHRRNSRKLRKTSHKTSRNKSKKLSIP